MKNRSRKVVIYARVSTAHHGQNPEVQLAELRQYCESRGWNVVEEIIDHGYSGSTDQRPGLKRLMELVRARKCDVVAVFKLDRLFRSLKHLVNALDELTALGVEFVSLRDSLDFTTPAGRLLFGVLACLAEFEKDLIRERTIAGLDHARRNGKQLGRPRHDLGGEIRRLRDQRLSLRAIASKLGVSRMTVARALQVSQKPLPKGASAGTEDQGVGG